MKAKLIAATFNPIDVMWIAARTCYASESPINMWNNIDTLNSDKVSDRHWKLVKQVLDSGHLSVAEHINFTFAIDSISRACSHQLVRHRHCTFSQQSQRYVKFDSGEFIAIVPSSIKQNEDAQRVFDETMEAISIGYAKLIELGTKAEDARSVLPNACATNITVTLNFRELMHICNERLCARAQTEIRQLTKLMVDEVKLLEPRLTEYLVPKCEINGFCKEHNCCGRRPSLKSIKETL